MKGKKKNNGTKKARNNFLNSTISVNAPTAKEGAALLAEMSKGEKKRFLDFVTTTTNFNSGTQQYGAGQKLERSAMPPMPVGGRNGGSKRPQITVIPYREEKIFTVTTPNSSGFNVDRFQINPGLLGTFPWLSQVAQGYEKYRFRRIRARFVPKVGVFSDAAKVGNVLMSVDYDSVDPDPPGTDWMENNDPHVVGVANKTLTLDFEGASWHFIRSGNVPAGTDIRLYDACTLFVATSDLTVTNEAIGKIYLDYEVELAVPQQQLAATDDKGVVLPKPMERTFTCTCINSTSGAGQVPGAYQTLTSWVVSPTMNALGVSVTGANNYQINLTRGNYIVRFDGLFDLATTSVGALLYPSIDNNALRVACAYAVGASLVSISATWQVSVSDTSVLLFNLKQLCTAVATSVNMNVIITTC